MKKTCEACEFYYKGSLGDECRALPNMPVFSVFRKDVEYVRLPTRAVNPACALFAPANKKKKAK